MRGAARVEVVGRWLTPDPVAGDILNPQSLNRYAYVLNNPTTLTDPLGLETGVPSSCSDITYAISHAECGSSPLCQYFMLPCGTSGIPFPPVPPAGGGGGGGIPGGGGAPGGGMPGNASNQGPVTIDCGLDPTTGQVVCIMGGVQVTLNQGSTNRILQVLKWLLYRPWAVSWIIPVVGITGAVGAGPAGGFAFNPATHTLCGSLGVGVAAGHTVAGGPITDAHLWKDVPATPSGVNRVLAGGSVSGGINSPVGFGYGGMINLTGAAGGWTIGVPGGSLASTDTVCMDLW
ncbi:MAG TPA: RHS repeat-associated core domain-containing protein [Terriglobia bacterium]|nr:RHS repeat-associated core domain-containing protein [Terriglobia bacterium]